MTPFLTMNRARSKTALVASLTAVALVVSACSSASSSTENVTRTDTAVNFNPCTEAICDTTVDGFPTKIKMPTQWNGSLMIYSHEYRNQYELPYSKTTPAPIAKLAPTGKTAPDAIENAMLAGGYAVAGAAVPTGWQVNESMKAAQSVKNHFTENIAQPDRTYLWGESMGSLASAQLGQDADWVNGVIGYCGLMAGFNRNYDLALDAAASVKALLYPEMKLSNYSSFAEARKNYEGAMKAVKSAAKDKYGNDALKLYAVGVAAVVPTKSLRASGSSVPTATTPIAENLANILARSTIDRFAMEQQFGGNPSTNVGTDYPVRVTPKQTETADQTKKGALKKYLKTIQKSKRVAADAKSRKAANENGSISGTLTVPTVTLHGSDDELAIVQNEGDFVAKTVAKGADSRRFLSSNVTKPPLFYKEGEPAATGAGHCNFSDASIVGAVRILNDWVQGELYPTRSSVAQALGEESGYDPNFRLYQWPPGSPAL